MPDQASIGLNLKKASKRLIYRNLLSGRKDKKYPKNKLKKKNSFLKIISTRRKIWDSSMFPVIVLSLSLFVSWTVCMVMIVLKTTMLSSLIEIQLSIVRVSPTPSTTISPKKRKYSTVKIRVVLVPSLFIPRKNTLLWLRREHRLTSTSINILHSNSTEFSGKEHRNHTLVFVSVEMEICWHLLVLTPTIS